MELQSKELQWSIWNEEDLFIDSDDKKRLNSAHSLLGAYRQPKPITTNGMRSYSSAILELVRRRSGDGCCN